MAWIKSSLTPVDRLERELETQIKESYKEAEALRRKFDDDVNLIRRDAENRLAERLRLAKKQQAKLKDRVASAEEHKADIFHTVEVLQQQLAVTNNELHLARSQICDLNAEIQHLRARPPQVVERTDPGAFADAQRLRDRASVIEQQARRAHEAACEAREAVGREATINQRFQRDLDNTRHRLLTVQGSLAEAVEENAGLRREIESERMKSAAGSRRLADAVERHDAALDEVRCDSLQLRAQRDRFAQDHAALGVKLRQIEKQNGATRILNVLNQVRLVSLARALRTWEVSATKAIYSRKQARQQERHDSELALLEVQLRNAETRCKNTHCENEALRDSRERVAEAVATVGRRRGGMAAVVEERGASALRWCFWGWARVAQRGEAVVAKRKEGIDAQRALPGVREMLAAAVDRARGAETERDRQSATVQMLTDEINRSKEDLENIRVTLEETQSLSSACRNRSIHLAAVRLHNIMERNRQDLLARAFAEWFRNHHVCALAKQYVEASAHPEPVVATDQAIVGQSWGIRRSSAVRNAQMVTEREATETSTSTLAPLPGIGTSPNYAELRDPSNSWYVSSTVTPPDASHTACDDLLASARPGRCKQPTNNADVVRTRNNPIIAPRRGFLGEERRLQVPDVSSEGIDSEEVRFDAQGAAPRDASTYIQQGSPLSSSRLNLRAVIQDGRENERTNGNCTVNDRGTCTEAPKITGSPSDEPLGDRISIVAAQAPDSPRLILAMRMALGEQLYDVGERLMRCVEADHREMHSRPYRPIPLTGAEREQVRACIEDASRGTLRHGVLAFLRAQDSYRAVAVERVRADTKTTYSCNGDLVQRKSQSSGRVRDACESDGARRMATFRGKDDRLGNATERRYDLSSLTTGLMSSPAEKAAAARLLRDRLIAILEDANEAWQSRRRTLNTFDFGIESGTPCYGGKAPFATRGSARYSRRWGPYERGGALDSGAGPRKFWEAVVGSRFVEPSWNIEIEILEEQIWKIVTLVRDQDHHHQRLALGRGAHLRRILDLRVYELLLLHVRTRLIWDGIAEDVPQTTSWMTPSEGVFKKYACVG